MIRSIKRRFNKPKQRVFFKDIWCKQHNDRTWPFAVDKVLISREGMKVLLFASGGTKVYGLNDKAKALGYRCPVEQGIVTDERGSLYFIAAAWKLRA